MDPDQLASTADLDLHCFKLGFICLFDLILYVPSTIFQL